jgi:Tfp pilus assembly protein PilN
MPRKNNKHLKNKCMKLQQFFLCSMLVLLSCHICYAQDILGDAPQGPVTPARTESDKLFSPPVGRTFYDIAYELANNPNITAQQIEQAITLYTATIKLDSSAKYILPDMIRLLTQHPQRDYSELMYQLLINYVDKSADLEVTQQAISYLISRMSSREEREQLLEQLLAKLGGKSAILDSELSAQIGLLKAEKADLKTAQSYFVAAYNNNNYNKLAFEKLTEMLADQITASMYLEHLRLGLDENPLDIRGVLTFAGHAERLELFALAADAYQYAAELFRFMRPSEALPVTIYLPWAISNYNVPRGGQKCLQIASDIRNSGRFDLLLEAIAGRAALKSGDQQLALTILKTAENKAIELSMSDDQFGTAKQKAAGYQRLAWFYSFAMADYNKSVVWANKAYSADPNSADSAAILAYSLVMSGQTDWPKLLLDNYPHNQIADLALALIQLSDRQIPVAVETLKAAIAKDPSSFAAEQAKQILTKQGAEYIPPSDPTVIMTALTGQFGQNIVPNFLSPENLISVKLKLRGSRFSYDTRLEASVAIENNSSHALVVSDNAFFKGYIRIDARISGDINATIANLVTLRVRPASPIESGRGITVPVQLLTGELKKILLNHPQASLKIEFDVFVDPVITDQGAAVSSLAGMAPAKATIERPRIELTSKYLQNKLDSLSKGRQGQKTTAAQLFAGLLTEQQIMAKQEPTYKFVYADWMPELLTSALKRNLVEPDWVVRVHTMAAMLPMQLDYELTTAVSESLDDSRWPVRMMAIYLLAKSQGPAFAKVLEWTAKEDKNEYVRQMATALLSIKPAPAPAAPPAEIPTIPGL